MRYAILSTGRNGGNLLCDVLSQTGVAGMVGKDGGHRGNEVYIGHGALLAERDIYHEVSMFFVNNATPNGVQGAKINYQYLLGLQRWSNWRTIDDILLSLDKAIVLVRRDKVAQAVSRLIASREMDWAAWQKKKHTDATYNRRVIASIIARHAMGDAYFLEFCAQHGITHTTIAYEDVAPDVVLTSQHLIRFLEIDDSGVDWGSISPRLEKQTDTRKHDWVRRYKDGK
jgi:LPS sulfotransferase NodH